MTTAQRQHLLAYLGFDPGPADGITGVKTRAATAAFQAAVGQTSDGAGSAETDDALKKAVWEGMPRLDPGDFWQSIRYFRREEFRCPCPRCGGFPAEPKARLVQAADRIRGQAGSPADVSSGVRCAAHNAELSGSVPNSRHLTGGAMDFCIRGMPSEKLLTLAKQQPEIIYAYAIDGSFIHMDIGS